MGNGILESLLGLACILAFFCSLGGGICLFVLAASSPDYRTLWRTFRQGRFGLRTAFGLVATIAITFGLLTVLGVDTWNAGSLCTFAIVLPAALFFVTLVGALLTEMFDNKSTRSIVDQRMQEDELTKFVKEKQAAAQNGPLSWISKDEPLQTEDDCSSDPPPEQEE